VTGHKGAVLGVSFLEHYVITASGDKTLRIYDPVTDTCLGVITGHLGSVNAVATAGGGSRRVVSCSGDGLVKIYELGKFLEEAMGRQGEMPGGSNSMPNSGGLGGAGVLLGSKTAPAGSVRSPTKTGGGGADEERSSVAVAAANSLSRFRSRGERSGDFILGGSVAEGEGALSEEDEAGHNIVR